MLRLLQIFLIRDSTRGPAIAEFPDCPFSILWRENYLPPQPAKQRQGAQDHGHGDQAVDEIFDHVGIDVRDQLAAEIEREYGFRGETNEAANEYGAQEFLAGTLQ